MVHWNCSMQQAKLCSACGWPVAKWSSRVPCACACMLWCIMACMQAQDLCRLSGMQSACSRDAANVNKGSKHERSCMILPCMHINWLACSWCKATHACKQASKHVFACTCMFACGACMHALHACTLKRWRSMYKHARLYIVTTIYMHARHVPQVSAVQPLPAVQPLLAVQPLPAVPLLPAAHHSARISKTARFVPVKRAKTLNPWVVLKPQPLDCEP